MKMDMRRSMDLAAAPCHEAPVGRRRSFPEAFLERATINGLQAVTSAAPGPQSARGTLAFGPFVFDCVNGLLPKDGCLLAQRGFDLVGAAFDARALSIGGPAVSLMPGALDGAGAPRFAMSATGVLVSGREHAPALEVVLDWTSELQRLVPAPQPRTLR